MILKTAEECIVECPRSRSVVTSSKIMENIMESHIATLARDLDRYRTLSHRTRTLLRIDRQKSQ